MRTTYALYQKYGDAREAVDLLLDKNIGKEEINIIAQKNTVEGSWNVNQRTIDVDVTDEVGLKQVSGLDAMLGRQRPVQTLTDGELYAAGEVAAVVVRTAVAPASGESSLAGALSDFGVSPKSSAAYAQGIKQGKLLVFVRTQDERASEVTKVLGDTSGKNVSTYGG